MKVYGYGRGSTQKQETTVEAQEDIVRRCARQRELGDGLIFFADKATSGKRPFTERKGGGLLHSLLRPGDILIIPKIDRAFRSFGDFVAMLQRWEDLKVRVILVDPSFEYDPNNPFTKTTLRMLAAFAELERELVSLRTKEGLELRIRQRVRYCHHAPYGYAWTNIQRDGRWVQVAQPDPTEQQIMRRIVLMRNTDPPHSWTQIREYLNYELRIPPRQNRGAVAADWDVQRIRRIYQAALRDQIRNAGQLA